MQTFNVTVRYTASRYCSEQNPNGYTVTHKSVIGHMINRYRAIGEIIEVIETR
jgi:hypothetical protein